MDKLELTGLILKGGKMDIPLRIQLIDWLNQNIGKNIKLVLQVKRLTRSNPQNRFYWGVCVPLVQAGINNLGHRLTKEETHEFLKKELNSKEVDLHNGYYIMIPGSTTEMSTTDFMAFIERIQQFAAEILGITIPNPNEKMEFDF